MLPIVRATLFALADSSDVVRFTREELDEVSVALQEACTNAIRHAHRHDASKSVRIEFIDDEVALVIRVIDQGTPFQLKDTPLPDPESLQEGGYGISIMRAWMDDVRLDRVGDQNVLTLRRMYRAPADSEEIERVAAR
jgi:serine/threonine-protein kinase RsbW